jgi:hypothetical protein
MVSYLSVPEAARRWDRPPNSVQMFCRRGLIPGAFKNERGWWRIPEGDEPPGLHRTAKLTEDERREIARLAHAGANRSKLARDYGVERQHVYHLMGKYPPEGGG